MYIILELQANDNWTTVVTPIQTAEEKNEAMSKYHGILFSAAISSVPCHTAMVIDERGQCLARETYVHLQNNEVTE